MPEIYDLTGQNIENTYQRILQTPDGINFYNGTGSIVPIATTGSNIFIGNQTITGSLTVTNGITGSLYGTASWAINTLTASYAIAASDILISVLNQSGVQINKGAVVHISGSDNSSNIPRVRLADWTNDSLSANTLGLATTNIANGAQGQVLTEGLFLGYDTDTPNWNSGQLIYLGPNGTITGSAPSAPLHTVRLGQVVRVNQNNGSIYVKVDNGYELDELHNVKIGTAATGDVLMYSGSVWINTPATQTKERRYDSSASFAYCGTAPKYSLETDLTWFITRIFISSSGATTITSASMVNWTNRYTHTYY